MMLRMIAHPVVRSSPFLSRMGVISIFTLFYV
jgi:hypothetical protein